MKYEDIIADLKKENYAPIYFLTGEEPYFLDKISEWMEEHVLSEDEKAFNQVVFYGNDVSMTTVTDTARRFPMMSSRQVVIVKEAQNIRDFDNLLPYIDHFQTTTILVFLYKNKKPDKRKGVFKKLGSSKNCVYFESARLYENKIPDWIIDYCKEKKCMITMKAAGILAESLGNDLSKVANELDKLMLLLPGGGEIKENLIEEHTGISKEYNTFELINAIIRQDHLKANRIVNYFEANPKNNPLVLTIATLFKYFRDLLTFHYQKKTTPNQQEMARLLGINPYFIKDYTEGSKKYNAIKCANIISWLRKYDMKSKGVGNSNISDGELLKELIFKIMH
ncbi:MULTISPECIES: DNA polymerase III subunit delta [Sanguibacteroides]|uniref:DNA polymerase III subunit delta n=1 Tax=Sanguibacteroides justesenii TaxID=1547597 RepID=A0AB34R6J4_9PORP|nr:MULTISPECIES: DNA polymerase III subunit delta [Sanguibacteroides]KIO43712.1 DNA polymerase III subunit delta [Sanguibacteroides justesenii]PXZ45042.1 DNA polymerase III subunit delta [Sanguibacteroides justesenii]